MERQATVVSPFLFWRDPSLGQTLKNRFVCVFYRQRWVKRMGNQTLEHGVKLKWVLLKVKEVGLAPQASVVPSTMPCCHFF